MKKFVSKIARSGFYIILFLCISAIGISGYIIHLTRNTAETVEKNIGIESSVEIPFPKEKETIYDFGTELEMPVESKKREEAVSESMVETQKEEPKPEVKKEVTAPKKEEPVIETASISEDEEVVYTMALMGAVTAPFSGDELVKNVTTGDWRTHSGVDIKGEPGTDVKAIADGTVLSVQSDTMLGNTVTIEHEGGLVSIYANLSDGITLKAGDKVKGGDAVGKVGQSALCECLEEPHLHLEVKKDGKSIDPLSLFPGGEE